MGKHQSFVFATRVSMDVVSDHVLRTVRPSELANELYFLVVGEDDVDVTMGPIERHRKELKVSGHHETGRDERVYSMINLPPEDGPPRTAGTLEVLTRWTCTI